MWDKLLSRPRSLFRFSRPARAIVKRYPRVWEKAWPSLASDNRVVIVGYLERACNSGDIVLFQFLSRPLSRQLAILFLYTVPIGHEYALP